MVKDIDIIEETRLSLPAKKKLQLFLKQKATLDFFLERGAISQAQYDKSLSDMQSKMFGRRTKQD